MDRKRDNITHPNMQQSTKRLRHSPSRSPQRQSSSLLPPSSPPVPSVEESTSVTPGVEFGPLGDWEDISIEWYIALYRLWPLTQGQVELWDIDQFEGVGEWERVEEILTSVEKWSELWGGVDAWGNEFEALFKKAIDGCTASRKSLHEIWNHARVGRQLLSMLSFTNVPLPQTGTTLRLLWRKKADGIALIAKGLAIIECRFGSDIMGQKNLS
jgi:hypothetical protein